MQVKWDKETWAYGRNGMSKCFGLDIVSTYDGGIIIAPINSRGGVTRCEIKIDGRAIAHLIEALKSYTVITYMDRCSDCFALYKLDGSKI